MNRKEVKTGGGVIPDSFFTRLGLALVLFFVAVAAAWQVSLYFYTKTVLAVHYRAVLLKLVMIREEFLVKSLVMGLLFFVVPCLAAAIFLVVYSHRVAGPMFRVRQYLKTIAGKIEAPDLSFREKDALHPLARAINEVRHRELDDLTRVSSAFAEMEEILGLAVEAKSQGKDPGPLLERAEHRCAGCAEILKPVKP